MKIGIRYSKVFKVYILYYKKGKQFIKPVYNEFTHLPFTFKTRKQALRLIKSGYLSKYKK